MVPFAPQDLRGDLRNVGSGHFWSFLEETCSIMNCDMKHLKAVFQVFLHCGGHHHTVLFGTLQPFQVLLLYKGLPVLQQFLGGWCMLNNSCMNTRTKALLADLCIITR